MDGILVKVSHLDWATAIVPVVNKNGTLSIFGDYEVIVNTAVNNGDYLPPK